MSAADAGAGRSRALISGGGHFMNKHGGFERFQPNVRRLQARAPGERARGCTPGEQDQERRAQRWKLA